MLYPGSQEAKIQLGLAILLGSLTPFIVVPLFALLMDRAFIVV